MKTKLDRKNIKPISFFFHHKRSEKRYYFETHNRLKANRHSQKIVNIPTNENININSTKRPLRADGLSLLPSALRPRLVGAFGVLVFSIIGSLLMQNSYVSEASAVSLTLTVPSAPLSVNLNPNTDNGFAKSTDGNISVSTAANWGFQLSVQAKDSNALKNGSSSLASITGPIDEATFKSGADYVNKWGFKPSKLNSAANTNFVAGPTTSPTIIEKTSASSASASQYTIAIGAKANNTLATGTYSNNFTFTATANTVSYNITYNLDSGTWSGKSPQTGSTIEKTIKLDENKPAKDGFEFLGWCTVEPTGNNTDNPTCDNSNNGTIYTAGQDYPLTNGSNTVTLNAIWKSTKPPLLTSIVTVDPDVNEITFKVGSGIEMIMVGDPTKDKTNYWRPSYGFSGTDIVMPVTGGEKILVSVTPKANYKLGSWTKTTGSTQTWTANGVSGTYQKMKDVTHATCVAAGEEGMNVTDERNGVSYTIGKFADRCWMFSNLRLEPGTVLNSTTSAVSSDFTLPTQADSDAWTSSSQDYYSKKSMKVCKGTAGYASSGAGNKCADQTVGVTEYYYNWYAAIANDAVGSSPTSNSSATTSLDSQSKGSICPKNWHLHSMPNDSTADVSDLTTLWNANKADNPGRLVSSGHFESGTQDYVGFRGYWWSSSRDDNGYARRVYLDRGSAYSGSSSKDDGYSVRCELPKPKENITELQYLQDWNNLTDDEKTQVKNSMQDETNYTLTDKRDNTQYTIAKLKDGKIWMTQNLRIGGEQPKDISSSDSDMTSGSFTIPASNLTTFKTSYSTVNNSAAYVDSTYGGYYTWYTATAGTGSSSITSGGQNTTSSICPKGWKLPTSGSSSSGDFADLVTAYGGNNSDGSAALRATPVPGFTYAGYVDCLSGSLGSQGSHGYYWSSTSGNSTYAYYLSLSSSGADPASVDYRVSGRSVRCVAR